MSQAEIVSLDVALTSLLGAGEGRESGGPTRPKIDLQARLETR